MAVWFDGSALEQQRGVVGRGQSSKLDNKPGVGASRNIEGVGIGDNARAITGLVLVLSDRVAAFPFERAGAAREANHLT